jgi:hypothetical protein
MQSYFKLLIVTGIVIVLASCSEWLNLEPEDGVIRQKYWKTKEHVKAAVIGCYISIQDGPVEKMFLWGELRGDMLENGSVVDNRFAEIIDGEVSAANSVVDWSSFYTTINNCNTVLAFAPGVRELDGTFTERQLNEYKAEVLTLRALMYFYLVRSFRDVPFVQEAYISDDQDLYLPKSPGSQILDTLVSDLKFASIHAPSSYPTNAENKSRITRWTARALLADIYLWQENYLACNNVCDEIIGSSRFSLMPVAQTIEYVEDGGVIIDSISIPGESDADRLFTHTYVYGASPESLFEIPFTTLRTNPFYLLMGPIVNRVRPKLDVVDEGVFPAPIYSMYSEASDIRGSGFSFRAGVVWKYVGTSRTGAPRAATEYTTPWLVYKYSDVLLMKAEALNQLGLLATGDVVNGYYQQSLENLLLVRNARNAVQTSEYKFDANNLDGKSLEKAILEERAREFAYEGKRWYDVLRYAKRGDYADTNLQYLIALAINSASPQKQQSLIAKYRDPQRNSHYWPIFVREIETNKNLQQNEFYAK